MSSRQLSWALLAIVLCGSVEAADLLDAPGPGYRRQSELLFPKRNSEPVWLHMRVGLSAKGNAVRLPLQFRIAPDSTGLPFSEPIRLFDLTYDNLAVQTRTSVEPELFPR